MQIKHFMNGGFVVHKLRIAGMSSTFSIWVSPYGTLRDAERFDASGRTYPVPRDSKAWARLDGRAEILASRM